MTLRERIENYPRKNRQPTNNGQRNFMARIPAKLHKRLAEAARDSEVSMNWLAMSILEDGLERLEK